MKIVVVVLAIIIIFVIVKKITNRGIAQVNVETAQKLIKDTEITILDVRTQQEYGKGHLQGARLIPVAEIAGRISELSSLKDRRILVYCHAGNRSATASAILRKNGFTKVSNLQGGITAWINSGNTVVKDN